MGNCASREDEYIDGDKMNKALVAEGLEPVPKKAVKLLLLGAGESGKSTIFKQMKIVHQGGYSAAELRGFVALIHSNTVDSMNAMMQAFDGLGVVMPDDLKLLYDDFQAQVSSQTLNPALGALTRRMWEHKATQLVFERRSEYQLLDSAAYFMRDVERLSKADFVPSEEDVLRSRVRTSGIVRTDVTIKSANFAIFDLGGQQNERRKWINAFSEVDAVIFVAALSEYDQMLAEDPKVNRMDDALHLWGKLVNSRHFKQTSMLLFLNKKDLFEEKLKRKPLKESYPAAKEDASLEDDTDFEQCSAFFKKAFLAKNENASKTIYTHITTATDTSNIQFVFKAVTAVILEANLLASGLM